MDNNLENHIKTQLPSRSKCQQELPKIVYNTSRGTENLEDNNISENKNSKSIYND